MPPYALLNPDNSYTILSSGQLSKASVPTKILSDKSKTPDNKEIKRGMPTSNISKDNAFNMQEELEKERETQLDNVSPISFTTNNSVISRVLVDECNIRVRERDEDEDNNLVILNYQDDDDSRTLVQGTPRSEEDSATYAPSPLSPLPPIIIDETQY